MHACMYVYKGVDICTSIDISIYLPNCIHINMYTHICIYIHVYVHLCVHLFILTHGAQSSGTYRTSKCKAYLTLNVQVRK